MQELLQQVEAFIVGAIPTALLFLVLVISYQLLVQGPLTAILKQRRARTEGAVEAAQKAMEQAEARAAEYAERLRVAKADVYKLREQRAQQWTAERDEVLDAARKAAHARVSEARKAIDAEAAAAREKIQGQAPELARQVVGAILPQAAGGTR